MLPRRALDPRLHLVELLQHVVDGRGAVRERPHDARKDRPGLHPVAALLSEARSALHLLDRARALARPDPDQRGGAGRERERPALSSSSSNTLMARSSSARAFAWLAPASV